MLAVEIRIYNENSLADVMMGMREWLDHRHFEPATFRYTFQAPGAGILCHIDFSNEIQAREFALAFHGRIVAVPEEASAPTP